MNALQNPQRPEENVEAAGPSGQQVLPTRNARQGVTGQNVRYVLGFGLVAIVIVFAVIYLIYFA